MRVRTLGGHPVEAALEVQVDLSMHTGLMAMPAGLRDLREPVQELRVQSGVLRALQGWLGGLGNLRRLFIQGFYGAPCPMRELPKSVGALTGLQELHVESRTGLSALPESVGRLTALQTPFFIHRLELVSTQVVQGATREETHVRARVTLAKQTVNAQHHQHQ